MFNILSFMDKDKSSQPFANRKAVMRWLDELPQSDILTTHAHILGALIRLRNQDTDYDKDKLEVLMALDEYARPLQATLCERYLRTIRMSTAMEAKLWQAIYAFYTEISLAYYSYITVNIADPTQGKLAPYLPQIALRVLFDIGNIFKWRFFHYDSPDEKLWRMLHKLFRIAETKAFVSKAIPLYGNDQSSCVNQYVRALLLTQIHPSALEAKQIEMADTWLLQWVQLVHLEKFPKAGHHHFYVDLDIPAGASAVTDRPYPESCLCWDASTLLGQLRRTQEKLQLPHKSVKSGLDARLPEYRKMLDYVELQWDPNNLGKLRKSPRIATRKVLNVVHGFNAICSVVKDSEKDTEQVIGYDDHIRYAEMVDIQLYGFVTEITRARQKKASSGFTSTEVSCESWGAEDESAEGYCAHIPPAKNDWLRLSRLVGVKVENEQHWKIAVVRRLIHSPGSGTHVGMEILGPDPALLMAYSISMGASQAEPDPSSLPSITALLTKPVQNGQLTIIIDSAAYIRNKLFKVNVDQEINILKLGNVLEKGDAWVHVQASLA